MFFEKGKEKKQTNNYFKVTAKCGHVGRSNYILKDFYLVAENGREAAARTRMLPRVKHDHKDAIRSVLKITEEEYLEGRNRNGEDPFFTCTSKQEQMRYMDTIQPQLIKEQRTEKKKSKPNYAYRYKKYGYTSVCCLLKDDEYMFG